MNKAFYFLLSAALFAVLTGNAQVITKQAFKPVYGQNAIKKKIFDVQAQASSMRKAADTGMRAPLKFKMNFRKFRKFNPAGAATSQPEQPEEQAALSTLAEAEAPGKLAASTRKPNVWSNFLAASFEETPYITPPDPSGDVSSSQVVVVTNASIKVFEKKSVTDAPLTTSKSSSTNHAQDQLFLLLDEFFAPLLPFGSYATDPHVRYDRLTKRWFFAAIEVNPALEDNHILLAVSDGEQLTTSSSLFYYRFLVSDVLPYNPTAPYAPFLDYPTLGVDRNAVVIGGVNFFWGFFGADSANHVGLLLDKKRLTRGQLLIYGLKLGNIDYTTGTGSGMYVPQGVHNDDASASRSYFAGITLDQRGLALASIDFNSGGIPVSAQGTAVPVEQFTFPRDITAPGSPMVIDPLDTRLFAAAIYKNKLTGKSGLWTAHAIGVNKAGNFVPDAVFVREARTAARWYEVENVYDKPSLKQYGTVFDNTKNTGRRAISYFNPSIASNGQGYAALSGTLSAYNRHLNVFVSDRFDDDGKNMLSEPTKVTHTDAIYALFFNFFGYIGRWGDFSQTVVDPDDDQTIWTFQEYANTDDSYGTRAVQLKAPPPATPLPLGTLSNKGDTVITISGLSVDHSGFFDPGSDKQGPGYKRLTVKSTGGLIASTIKFISPTEISCKLNTKNKPGQQYWFL